MFSYRIKVVRKNLASAFPEKSIQELRRIEREFYIQFCDLVVESIKLYRISKDELVKRCKLTQASIDMLIPYKNQNRSVALISGHCGNWEWVGSAYSAQGPLPLAVSYMLFPNPFLNRFLVRLRSRFGSMLVPTVDVVKDMIRNKHVPRAIGFIADQAPHRDYLFWISFMHQETPVFTGPEKVSQKFNLPVFFIHIKKIKRGFYEISTEKITDDPGTLPEGKLTALHTRLLEKDLEAQPFNWLWSHNRWKYKKPTQAVTIPKT